MSNYLKDLTALPYPKSNRVSVPSTADPTQYVSSTEWNTLCAAVDDLRNYVNNVFNVKTFGAKGDGTTDDTAAIQAAITAAGAGGSSGSGGTVLLPPGNYYVTDTLTVGNSYISIVGAGTKHTRFTFNPTSGKPLVKVSAGAFTVFGFFLSGMSFYATPGNTQKKTAIQLVDTSGAVVRYVDVDPLGRFTSTWVGSTSVGIQMQGREQTLIEHVNINADLPIQISADPNISTIGSDHLHMSDTVLMPTTGLGGSCVLIDSGVVVLNMTIDGYNAWLPDKYGLYWADSATATPSLNIKIQGVRCEQHVDATGTSIYINANTGGGSAGIQNLTIEDFRNSSGQNGLYLRGVNTATVRNSMFPTVDGTKSHLDVASCFDLLMENNYVNDTTLVSVSGMTKLFELTRRTTAANMGPTVHWSAATVNPTTLDSVAALNLGTTAATSVAVGRSGATTASIDAATVNVGPNAGTVNVGAAATTVAVGRSGATTATLDATTVNVGPNASTVNLGKSGANVFLPGGALRAGTAAQNTNGVAFTIGLNNGGVAGGGLAGGTGGGNLYTNGQGGAATTTAGETAGQGGSGVSRGGQGGTGAASVNGPGNGGDYIVAGGDAGSQTSGFGNANGGGGYLRGGVGRGTGTAGKAVVGDTNTSEVDLGSSSAVTVVKGGFAPVYRSAATPVTVATSDYRVGVSGTGARAVTLPAANTCKVGQEIIVLDVGNSTGVITISRSGSDTINGGTTTTISTAFGSVRLVTDGVSAWYIS